MGGVLNGQVRMYYTRPSDGKTYCFQPVPLLAESKEFLRTADGDTRLATIHQLTFNGTLLPTLPALSGVSSESSCISLLDRKRDQLCDALSEDRGDLLVVDGSGYPIISAKPLVSSLTFEEGILVQQSPYQVVFEFEEPAGSGYVREYNDSWEFSQQPDDTTSVTHQISALGIPNPSLGTSAIDNARNFVKSKITTNPDKTNSHVIKTPYVSSLLDVDGLGSYNKIFTESSDVTAGRYDVTETWVLSSGNFLDDRTVESQWELDEFGSLIKTIVINGTIQGYGNTTFDKITNAEAGFNSFVSPQIEFFAASGISSRSKSSNRLNGTVTYSLTLAPSGSGVNDQLTSRSISRQFERQDDGSVLQTITTSCQVRPESSSTIQDAIDFCFSNNFPIDSAEPIFNASLSGNLVSVSTTRDELAKSFSLTRSYTDQSTPLWREEYTVDRQQTLDSSVTQITIQGLVQGLGVESTTKSQDRFASASGAYYSIVEPAISARIAQITPTGTCVASEPVSKTLGINPLNGAITYSQVFETRFLTNNVNVLKEEIDISLKLRGKVVSSILIPGKQDGPVLQDQETYTGLEKSISINYTMRKNDVNCGTGNTSTSNDLLNIALAESNILIDNTPSSHVRGEKPQSTKVFKTQDAVTWNRQRLEFGRTVTWLYL